MTSSSYTKVLKQLQHKQAKLKKYLKHNAPKERKFGAGAHRCRLCGRTGAHMQIYDLKLCRQCFRENATRLGFRKYA